MKKVIIILEYIYAVRDKSTGKLVNNITNPRHRFWEKRGGAVSAIDHFNPKYHNKRLGEPPNKENLEVVKFQLVEVNEDGSYPPYVNPFTIRCVDYPPQEVVLPKGVTNQIE